MFSGWISRCSNYSRLSLINYLRYIVLLTEPVFLLCCNRPDSPIGHWTLSRDQMLDRWSQDSFVTASASAALAGRTSGGLRGCSLPGQRMLPRPQQHILWLAGRQAVPVQVTSRWTGSLANPRHVSPRLSSCGPSEMLTVIVICRDDFADHKHLCLCLARGLTAPRFSLPNPLHYRLRVI